MDGTPRRADGAAVVSAVTVRPGVRFTVVTGSRDTDTISRGLAAGAFPGLHRPLVALLEALVPPGGRVLDLGAHVGTFTLSAAALGYEVLAVEASPRNADLLGESLRRNGFGRARVVHAAVSDRPGTVAFQPAGPYGHVVAPGADPGEGEGVVHVEALAIDDLLDRVGWDCVDFLKLDVEGSELAALRGLARRLARPDAPPVFVESNGFMLGQFGATPETLKEALEDLGYRNHLVEPGLLRPWRRGELQPSAVVDLLATRGAPRFLGDGWRLGPPLAPKEVAGRVVATCGSEAHVERAFIAGVLERADPALLAARPVRRAVRALRADPAEDVRAAAARVPIPTPWHALLTRLRAH